MHKFAVVRTCQSISNYTRSKTGLYPCTSLLLRNSQLDTGTHVPEARHWRWCQVIHWFHLCWWHFLLHPIDTRSHQVSVSSASVFGLCVSWPKNKVQNTGSGTQSPDITVDSNIVVWVDNCIYLGSNQSSDSGSQPDMKQHIALASSVVFSLGRIWSLRTGGLTNSAGHWILEISHHGWTLGCDVMVLLSRLCISDKRWRQCTSSVSIGSLSSYVKTEV